jgi:hypothetical protein
LHADASSETMGQTIKAIQKKPNLCSTFNIEKDIPTKDQYFTFCYHGDNKRKKNKIAHYLLYNYRYHLQLSDSCVL